MSKIIVMKNVSDFFEGVFFYHLTVFEYCLEHIVMRSCLNCFGGISTLTYDFAVIVFIDAAHALVGLLADFLCRAFCNLYKLIALLDVIFRALVDWYLFTVFILTVGCFTGVGKVSLV